MLPDSFSGLASKVCVSETLQWAFWYLGCQKNPECLFSDRPHQYLTWYIRQCHSGPCDMEYVSGWGCKVGNALQPDSVQPHGMLFCCREAPTPLLFQEPMCQISTWLADQISGLAAAYTMWAPDRKGSEVQSCVVFRPVCWHYEVRAKSCSLYHQEGRIILRNKTNFIHRNSISFCQHCYSTLSDTLVIVVKFPMLPEWICTYTYNQAYGVITENNPPTHKLLWFWTETFIFSF